MITVAENSVEDSDRNIPLRFTICSEILLDFLGAAPAVAAFRFFSLTISTGMLFKNCVECDKVKSMRKYEIGVHTGQGYYGCKKVLLLLSRCFSAVK